MAGHLGELRAVDLLRGALTFAGLVGVPAALALGIAGSATASRGVSRRG